MNVLAIDPGNTESAYVVIDADCQPLEFDKVPNGDLRDLMLKLRYVIADVIAIEMVASYGMPVGKDVFETVLWTGRFSERCRSYWHSDGYPRLVYRNAVKVHHCRSAKAKDGNIIQALVDRFAPGAPNRGKGTKARPGWFYGFHSDLWQAYALAVYVADLHESGSASAGWALATRGDWAIEP